MSDRSRWLGEGSLQSPITARHISSRPPSACISFSLSVFHFLILFQLPLAHCSTCFLSLFFFLLPILSVISLQCTCYPSCLPFSLSPCLSSSVGFFFIHVPVLHSSSSIFLSSVYPFSILAPPLFILSLSLSIFLYAQSPF